MLKRKSSGPPDDAPTMRNLDIKGAIERPATAAVGKVIAVVAIFVAGWWFGIVPDKRQWVINFTPDQAIVVVIIMAGVLLPLWLAARSLGRAANTAIPLGSVHQQITAGSLLIVAVIVLALVNYLLKPSSPTLAIAFVVGVVVCLVVNAVYYGIEARRMTKLERPSWLVGYLVAKSWKGFGVWYKAFHKRRDAVKDARSEMKAEEKKKKKKKKKKADAEERKAMEDSMDFLQDAFARSPVGLHQPPHEEALVNAGAGEEKR